MAIKASELVKLLKHSNHIVQKRKSGQRYMALPFATARVSADGGQLSVELQRRGLYVRRSVAMEHAGPWSATVDAGILGRVVRRLGSRDVNIGASVNGTINISGAGVNATVRGTAEFPNQGWSFNESPEGITAASKEIRAALGRAASRASTDKYRRDITCVQFEYGPDANGNGKLSATGTCGSSLISQSIDARASNAGVFCIDTHASRLIARLLPNSGEVSIMVRRGFVTIVHSGSGLVVRATKSDANFPDWRKLVSPEQYKTTTDVVCDVGEMIHAINIAGSAADRLTGVVKVLAENGTLTVSAKTSHDSGAVHASGTVDGTGSGSMTIGVDSRLAVGVLKQMPKTGHVVLRMSGELDPIYVGSSELPDMLAVIMPMRLD